MNKARQGAGFTLVELLAVLAILAVLAALLSPMVSRALVSARASRSLSNMRQIGVALSLYAQDHGQYFPAVAVGNPASPWCRKPIDPYLPMDRNSENPIFSCPNAESTSGAKVRRAYSAGGAMYGLIGVWQAANASKPRRLLSINNPDKAVLLYDSRVFGNGLCRDGTDWGRISPDLSNASLEGNVCIDYRQGGKAHFMFADMHITALSPENASAAIPDHQTYEGI